MQIVELVTLHLLVYFVFFNRAGVSDEEIGCKGRSFVMPKTLLFTAFCMPSLFIIFQVCLPHFLGLLTYGFVGNFKNHILIKKMFY
jgi:hypothetical protein